MVQVFRIRDIDNIDKKLFTVTQELENTNTNVSNDGVD